jgi:hypothetical protein
MLVGSAIPIEAFMPYLAAQTRPTSSSGDNGWVLFIVAVFVLVGWLLYKAGANKQILAEAKREREKAQSEREAAQGIRSEAIQKEEAVTKEQLRLSQVEATLQKVKEQAAVDRQAILNMAKEKCTGFPWLAEAWSNYQYLKHLREAERAPGRVSAERVRQIARERRTVEKKLRVAQGIINYWTWMFPFLDDWTGDIDDDLLQLVLAKEIAQPIKERRELGVDPVRVLLRLPKEEYDKLTSTERNKRALDAYRSRRKSSWEIGRDYEQYVGYLYESRGYAVRYQGILEGYEDLGRDLIAKKGSETLIVQCKCWSKHKSIRENHVCQLFGTTVKYTLDYPKQQVRAILFTSTQLSDCARKFAQHLGIEFIENELLGDYPCIKCNISRKTGEKIYHLPFDQKYDETVVEPERGEFYAMTVEEAERQGFRRAWRWHGNETGE